MSRWKDLRTYREVNPYTGNPVDEDAPANATGVNVAGTGDDSSVVVVRRKRKITLTITAREEVWNTRWLGTVPWRIMH